MLDNYQKLYGYCLFSFADKYSTKKFLFINLRIVGKAFNKLLEYNRM